MILQAVRVPCDVDVPFSHLIVLHCALLTFVDSGLLLSVPAFLASLLIFFRDVIILFWLFNPASLTNWFCLGDFYLIIDFLWVCCLVLARNCQHRLLLLGLLRFGLHYFRGCLLDNWYNWMLDLHQLPI